MRKIVGFGILLVALTGTAARADKETADRIRRDGERNDNRGNDKGVKEASGRRWR